MHGPNPGRNEPQQREMNISDRQKCSRNPCHTRYFGTTLIRGQEGVTDGTS